MKHKEQVRLTAPFRASGVSIEVTGGELLGAQPSPETPLKAECFRRFRRWAGIRFEVPVEAGSPVNLDLDVIGETPILLPDERIRWIPAQPEPQLLKAAEKTVAEVTGFLCHRSEDAASDETKSKARIYFSLLDRRTNYKLGLIDPARVQPINAVWTTLMERIKLRRRYAADSSLGKPLPLHSSSDDVRTISELMLGVMVECFGEPLTDPARLAKIGEAHDVFSWGGLFLRSTQPLVEKSNTAPDGAAIFMFPEFAHLAIDRAIDSGSWTALLPSLTRMPALYLRVHELADPAFAPKPFEEYGAPPDFDAPEAELRAYARTLASQYDGLRPHFLGDELGRLIARAFPLHES